MKVAKVYTFALNIDRDAKSLRDFMESDALETSMQFDEAMRKDGNDTLFHALTDLLDAGHIKTVLFLAVHGMSDIQDNFAKQRSQLLGGSFAEFMLKDAPLEMLERMSKDPNCPKEILPTVKELIKKKKR